MEHSPVLQQALLDAVNRHAATEKVAAKIEKLAEGLVEEVINDAFARYSDLGKQLRSVISSSLKLPEDLNALDLPAYGNTIINILRAKVEETGENLINARLAEQMDEILSMAPSELKLSDVVTSILEDNNDNQTGADATCIVVWNDNHLLSEYCTVYLSERGHMRKDDCEVRVHVQNEVGIYNLTVDGKDANKVIRMGAYRQWQKMLFSAFACGSKFIVDEDAVVTSTGW